jgi:hypothetical protein
MKTVHADSASTPRVAHCFFSEVKVTPNLLRTLQVNYSSVARISAVDALLLEGDDLLEELLCERLIHLDLLALHLHAHLILRSICLDAEVFLVWAATVAATMVHDGDDGCHRALVARASAIVHGGLSVRGAKKGGSHSRRRSGLHDLATARLHGHHGREGGGGARKGEESSSAREHVLESTMRARDSEVQARLLYNEENFFAQGFFTETGGVS